MRMIRAVTHNSGFHADDVFAMAALQLHVGKENIELVRTRDEALIATGDWVFDVGGVYDPATHRFDHHQNDAPVRENGIPYAAFGLVWKHVGESVSGSAAVASRVEQNLVMAIDAADNGVSLFTLSQHGIRPTTLSDMVALFCPPRGSTAEDIDAAFLQIVDIARAVLEHAIAHASMQEELAGVAREVYAGTADKRVLVFDAPMSKSLMIDFPDVLFMISPHDPAANTNWVATAIAKGRDTFELRHPFPAAWAGLRHAELVEASGVADAIFCHRNRFLFVAASKEGALAAVEKALQET